MTKEKEKDLQISTDKVLNDEELEQVSGGQIELVGNDPTGFTGGRLNTKPLSGGDHIA